MTLGELIADLRKRDPTKVVSKGWGRAHSYRGYYDELAFEPRENVSVGEMLREAEGALGRAFTGYKGGEYVMNESTPVWIASYGDFGGGEQIGPTLLWYMLGP